TSASGKSTNSKLVAQALGFVRVDTGAMYRTLAWYCLKRNVDVQDPQAVAAACRQWKTSMECVDNHVHLLVDGYFPEQEIRAADDRSGSKGHQQLTNDFGPDQRPDHCGYKAAPGGTGN